MGIGGLDNEFNAIFRRAFASRVFPPEIIEQLGCKHVKGILLYGPPGKFLTKSLIELHEIRFRNWQDIDGTTNRSNVKRT